MNLFRQTCAVAFGLLTGLSLCVRAAQTNVSVIDDDYSPGAVTINVNDSVKWVWGGNNHSTTSSTGLWNSGVHNTGFTFTNKFGSAGSFSYFCSVHTFMVGSVSVLAPNSPPVVALTNPPNGSVFSAPATIRLTATALDTGGSVTNVQFLQGTTSLGNRTVSPYSLFVSNLVAGAYNFSAVASDNTGLKATNGISVTVVTPTPVIVTNLRKLSPTQFRFDYSADAGLRYVVERSATLSGFAPLLTNTAPASSVSFTDNVPGLNTNFYRVGRLPNP